MISGAEEWVRDMEPNAEEWVGNDAKERKLTVN